MDLCGRGTGPAAVRTGTPNTKNFSWLLSGSGDSTQNVAVLMGLVTAYRFQGIDAHNYLLWAIERRGTSRNRARPQGAHARGLKTSAGGGASIDC